MSYKEISQMTSAKSVEVELELGQETIVQLGSQIQVRGLKVQDSVIYPRFTGVHIEDSSIPAIFDNGGRSLFRTDNQDPASIISEDIIRSGASTVFPTEGVIKVKVQIAYRVIATMPGSRLTVTYGVVSPSQGDSTFQDLVAILDTPSTGIYTLEFSVLGTEVLLGNVRIDGGTIEILRNLSGDPTQPADTFAEMTFLGKINDQL